MEPNNKEQIAQETEANEISGKNPRDEFISFEIQNGFKARKYVSDKQANEYEDLLKNGEPLPSGVYATPDGACFFTLVDTISDAEKERLIMYKNAKNINTIKNCVLFFTIMSIIAAVYYVIQLLN